MIKTCKQCRARFQCRKADHDRGWARFCSKSCKASHQGVKPYGSGKGSKVRRKASRPTDGACIDCGAEAPVSRRCDRCDFLNSIHPFSDEAFE